MSVMTKSSGVLLRYNHVLSSVFDQLTRLFNLHVHGDGRRQVEQASHENLIVCLRLLSTFPFFTVSLPCPPHIAAAAVPRKRYVVNLECLRIAKH